MKSFHPPNSGISRWFLLALCGAVILMTAAKENTASSQALARASNRLKALETELEQIEKLQSEAIAAQDEVIAAVKALKIQVHMRT